MRTGTPRVEERDAIRYIGVAATTSMGSESVVVRGAIALLHAWLGARGLSAVGAPFVRYNEIDMPDRLEIETCLPIDVEVEGRDPILVDTLPPGRYAVLEHRGPLEELVDANAQLQQWAEERGLRFAMRQLDGVSVWSARIERYLSDPEAERPRTEIAYRLE